MKRAGFLTPLVRAFRWHRRWFAAIFAAIAVLAGLSAINAGTQGDLEYLRILHLAASTMETDVAAALELLLVDGQPITSERVKPLVTSEARSAVPALVAPPIDLGIYDALLAEVAA